jgi:type IV secretory pathway TrbF-like protein
MENQETNNEPEKRHAGRKSKCTPEVIEKICNYLRQGNTRKTSAILAGIGQSTLYEWFDSNPELLDTIKRAEEEAVAMHVQTIQQASQANWQASAWWLERRRKEDFGKQDRLDVTTNGKDLQSMTVQQLDAEIERLKSITSETD